MRPFKSMSTTLISPDGTIEEEDSVAIETVLELRIGNEFIAAFLCSPGNEKELALGYLLSTGMIEQLSDIEKIEMIGNRCRVTVREGTDIHRQRGFSQIRRFIGTECSAPELLRELRTAQGIPRISESVDVDLVNLVESRKRLQELQVYRRRTGAFHGALLQYARNDEYVLAEDLGRHNAVDKAIGLALLQGMDLSKSFLISSGRLTADIVSKCGWAGVPLLASFAVATDAGVKFAQKANVTLVGSFKGSKMRIYNNGAAKIIV